MRGEREAACPYNGAAGGSFHGRLRRLTLDRRPHQRPHVSVAKRLLLDQLRRDALDRAPNVTPLHQLDRSQLGGPIGGKQLGVGRIEATCHQKPKRRLAQVAFTDVKVARAVELQDFFVPGAEDVAV